MHASRLKDTVFLTQTDTTIGFVSQNADKLTEIKQRPAHKHYIKAVNSLQTLTTFTRVPQKHKNRVRRSTKTTFVMPNKESYRIIFDKHHLLLLDRLKWVLTSSANLSNEAYDEVFAKKMADVIVEPLMGTREASRIYKLGTHTLKRIR